MLESPDPYDLPGTERLVFDTPVVIRSQTVFAISEYVKLESPALAELVQPSGKAAETSNGMGGATSTAPPAGRPDDWSMEDLLA